MVEELSQQNDLMQEEEEKKGDGDGDDGEEEEENDPASYMEMETLYEASKYSKEKHRLRVRIRRIKHRLDRGRYNNGEGLVQKMQQVV